MLRKVSSRFGRFVMALAVASAPAACDRIPAVVYVPVTPPEVTLLASASPTGPVVGEPVILHVERRYQGTWRQVARADLAPGQCWLTQPPPAIQAEVADNVHWQVMPAGAATFNTALREDHTREVAFTAAGTYVLELTSSVWCGAAVHGLPITIVASALP